MESPERKSVEAAIALFRRILFAVKVLPFLFSGFCLLSAILVKICSPDSMFIIDGLVYISPLAVGALLWLSHILRLCWWHKTACILPLVAQLVGYIDSLFHQFTYTELLFFCNAYCMLMVVFFISVHKTFLCDDRERIVRHRKANA